MNARLDEFSSSVEALSLCISKLASALDVAAAGKAKRDQAVNALEDRVHQWQSDLSDAQTDDLVLPEVNFSMLPVAYSTHLAIQSTVFSSVLLRAHLFTTQHRLQCVLIAADQVSEATAALRKAASQLAAVDSDADLASAQQSATAAIDRAQIASRLLSAEKERVKQMHKMRQVPHMI